MQNRALRVGPVAIPAAITNLLNCALTSLAGPVGYTPTQPYIILTHIRITNKTGAAVTLSMYIGATGGSAAGTEFALGAYSIPANSFIDIYERTRLDAGDFLTGIAGTATALTFQADGEIGFA